MSELKQAISNTKRLCVLLQSSFSKYIFTNFEMSF